jgi:hypothetical protein
MDDIFSYLTDAAQAAGTIGTAVTNATKTAATTPSTATVPTSTAPTSYKTLYIIGGIVVGGLALLLIIPRLFRK